MESVCCACCACCACCDPANAGEFSLDGGKHEIEIPIVRSLFGHSHVGDVISSDKEDVKDMDIEHDALQEFRSPVKRQKVSEFYFVMAHDLTSIFG